MSGVRKRVDRTLPPGVQELMTKGVLFPDPNIAPVMHCATCGLPVMLVWKHEPGTQVRGVAPGTVWGKDVDVVCMCCSYADCPHKKQLGVQP